MMMDRLTLRRFGANSHDFLSNGRRNPASGKAAGPSSPQPIQLLPVCFISEEKGTLDHRCAARCIAAHRACFDAYPLFANLPERVALLVMRGSFAFDESLRGRPRPPLRLLCIDT